MAASPFGTRMPVALLGATGSVGQRFVELLADHPWFELVRLGASEASAGRPYGEVVRWALDAPLPERAARLPLEPCTTALEAPLVFSALDAEVAGPIERAFADDGRVVVTNAKSHRMDPDVPLVVPEVNPGALDLLEGRRGRGAIVANPNCTTIGLALALKPLADRFGLRRVSLVSLQALSGAGLGGPTAYAMTDNVLPFVAGEEEKVAEETRELLGEVEVSATCTRVPVIDGHTLAISVELGREAARDELVAAWRDFRGAPQELGLPSAPARPTVYLADEDAPQPRRHRDLERGMATVVGRLRPCPLLGWKLVALSHNTRRGAAGGAILVAELLAARGLLGG